MTDETERPQPNDDDLRFAPPAEPEPAAHAEPALSEAHAAEAATPALDIDAALAAVSSLDDVLAEQEAREQAHQAREQAAIEERARREARLRSPEQFFPMPPLLTPARGRADSVVPALALIGIGGWLTLTVANGTPPDAGLVALAALGGVVASLLARWLVARRWARGALFAALALALTGGAVAFALTGPGLAVGWPLILLALGAAALLTALFSRPPDARPLPAGLGLIAAGAAALAVTSGALPAEGLTLARDVAPVALGFVALVLALPLIFRRR